jgi:hypothetical protein
MNLERFRLPTGLAGSGNAAGRPPRPGPSEHFLKGPVPLGWLKSAAALPGKASTVGLYLWYLAGLKKSNRFALPTAKVETFGVNRFAQYRALTALAEAGLISVARHCGRHPVITLRAAPAQDAGAEVDNA